MLQKYKLRIIFLSILLLNFILHIIAALCRHMGVGNDEAVYLLSGKNFLSGNGYTFPLGEPQLHHPPLFPIITGIIDFFIGNLEVSSMVSYIIFGTFLIIPVYLLAREIYGEKVACISSLLLCVLPAVSVKIPFWCSMAEPPTIFFLYWGLYFAFVALKCNTLRAYSLSAAFFALTSLTRPDGFVYFLTIGLFLFFYQIFKKFPLNKVIPLFGWYVIVFILINLPYSLFIHKHTGTWNISPKITTAIISYGPEFLYLPSGGVFDDPQIHSQKTSVLAFILESPTRIIIRILKNIRYLWFVHIPNVFPFYLFLFVGVWLSNIRWKRDFIIKELFLVIAIIPILGYTLSWVDDRFCVFILPVLLIITANGAYHIFQNIPSLKKGLLIIITLMLLFQCCDYLLDRCRYETQQGNKCKQVGKWITNNLPRTSIIMSITPRYAFYANTSRWCRIPFEEYSKIIDFAKSKAVTILILDKDTICYRPQLRFIFENDTIIEPDLLLLNTQVIQGEKISIFKIIY